MATVLLGGDGGNVRGAEAAIGRPSVLSGAAVLIASGVYLALNLFTIAGVPFLLSGDQVFFWMRAERLLAGEQIYRDFLEFTPPGTDLLYQAAFRLLGARVWVPNVVVLLLGLALAWLCWRIARSIMRRSHAALAVALFVVLVYGRLLNGTHHWFSVLAVLAAIAVLLEERTSARIAAAGGLLGVAAFFTQTRGPVAALAISAALLWERSRTGEPWLAHARRQALLFGSLALASLALESHYLATLGWRSLYFFQVTYVQRYAVNGWNAQSLGWPQTWSRSAVPGLLQMLFACAVLPAVYGFSLYRLRRHARQASSDATFRVLLIAAVGAAMFMEILPSPSWLRLFCVSAPGVILIGWLLSAWHPSGEGRLSRQIAPLLWAGLVGLGILQTASRQVHQADVIVLPAGRVATSALPAAKLKWLATHTRPGEDFLQAGWPGVYLPLAVRNPIFLDELDSGAWNRMGYLALAIRQIDTKAVPIVLWAQRLDSPSAGLGQFREYLARHYRRVWTFPDQDEVWARDADARPRNGPDP